MAQSNLQGEYNFRKQEMVAGLNFSADGKFWFYYSYGAVDRHATGAYTVQGDTLHLTSDKEPGKDFTVLNQFKHGFGYTLSFNHPNSYLLKDIRCIFSVNGKNQEAYTDNNGEVHVEIENCDTIYVQHSLYPDIVTTIKDSMNSNNRFTITLNPSLEQVSFKAINFKIENGNNISCLPNYFMEVTDIKFIKQSDKTALP